MNIVPTDLFSALSHETRLRCIMLLLEHNELCVCEFTFSIGASQPHISRNLAQLRTLGLVTDRREGLWIHYRINSAMPEWVFKVLEDMHKGLRLQSPFVDDRQSIASMPNRPGAPRCA